MAEIVNIGNGSLVLLSEESVRLVNDLASQGMFWEFVSTLIEKEVKLRADDAPATAKQVEALSKQMSDLAKLFRIAVARGGTGAPSASSPDLNNGQVESLEEPVEVKKEVAAVKLDPKVLGGKMGGVLGKMRDMGGKA